jgi:hypothetical protein
MGNALVYDEHLVYDYDVVTHTTLATMVTNVKQKLGEGWHLYGGFVSDGTNFMQPVVKAQRPATTSRRRATG